MGRDPFLGDKVMLGRVCLAASLVPFEVHGEPLLKAILDTE